MELTRDSREGLSDELRLEVLKSMCCATRTIQTKLTVFRARSSIVFVNIHGSGPYIMGVIAMIKEGRMWPIWYMTEESYNKRPGIRLWTYSSRCSKVYGCTPRNVVKFVDALLAMWSSQRMYSSQMCSKSAHIGPKA